MERRDGILWLSPSDLNGHLGCAHLTTLALEAAEGKRPKPAAVSEYLQMVFDKGSAHERDYLELLRERGRTIVEVAFERGDWASGAARTAELMREGADVIYQAPFALGEWRGVADFLERIDEPSDLGSYSYEAVDTKLARNEMLPHHALQLVFYAAGIQSVQGRRPLRVHVQLGSGERESIRLHEIDSYANHAKRGMLRAVDARAPTEPIPCEHCPFCPFQPTCAQAWEDVDHLSRVAGLRRDHSLVLSAAGVTTLTDLAQLPAGSAVAGLRPDALAALMQQARLQHAAVAGQPPPYELLTPAEGRGFALLPEPSEGDVMFDFEGDPFWTPARGLMFLVGLLLREGHDWRYQEIWAHDEAAEQVAFETLVDLLSDRLRRYPAMHVYHYSAAEPSEVKRLMAHYATREVEVDDLLRRKVFVDLLTVTKQALRAGVRSYSLKQTERLAGFARAAEMGAGSDAVLGYEKWRSSREPGELERIAAYNEEDCHATLALRDWLIGVRPPGGEWLKPIAADEHSEERIEAESERARLRMELIADAAEGSPRRLAGELLEYHRREARPAWWHYFARQAMDDEELFDDSEALAGLEPVGPPREVPHNYEFDFRFPAQNHKIGPGTWVDPATAGDVRVWSIDDAASTLVVRRGRGGAPKPLPGALIPGEPLATWDQRAALQRLAVAVRDGDPRFRALQDVLACAPPRFADVAPGAEIQTTVLEQQRRLARALDESSLVVQGPPGTGKTWLGARLIVDLMGRKKRVGVTAMSHKAINNLLAEIEVAAVEAELEFRGARKANGERTQVPEGGQIENVTGNVAACFDARFQLVAGTTWLFAPEAADDQLDYLVIDEAGQLSLADALAAGTSARNLILLGDPLQLPHVSQAVHPEGTSLSVLQHLLGDSPTVPPSRGLFLTQTWRMHPAVCTFISEEVYASRLESHPDCANQGVGGGAGIRYLPVEHAGNASSSPEEAETIRCEIERLLGQTVTDMQGRPRPLTASDCMVVTPYNAQVRILRQALGGDVRVGTVDLFQGQEAPVVFFSMATSSGEDAPRDVSFLFNRNRLNVAISRSRCLAYLVCAPALFETRARTLEQMRLVSTLCALADVALEP
jgi:predicted RecB family nuclease